MTSRWTPEMVAGIPAQHGWQLPVIGEADVVPMLDDMVAWDMWPVADPGGGTPIVAGRRWWFFLAAPRRDDPDLRHDEARIRLFSHGEDGWRDEGDGFPDGFAPGSREWSGSAVLHGDGTTLDMYFTAAGRRGAPRTFEQRLFETRGRLTIEDGRGRCEGWTTPREIVAADGIVYAKADQAEPVDGRILGFRDPGYFRDPADGAEYMLFTASDPAAPNDGNGLVGIARRAGDAWVALPPPVSAAGTNGELERAHVVVAGGLYYLFWSTQGARFAAGVAGVAGGVNGLYAMVADGMAGPWRPVNGTGLVAGNPEAEPTQAYCWWVTGELDVISFVDIWGTGGIAPVSPADRACRFGGTVAPLFRLVPDGDRIAIE